MDRRRKRKNQLREPTFIIHSKRTKNWIRCIFALLGLECTLVLLMTSIDIYIYRFWLVFLLVLLDIQHLHNIVDKHHYAGQSLTRNVHFLGIIASAQITLKTLQDAKQGSEMIPCLQYGKGALQKAIQSSWAHPAAPQYAA